MPVETRFERLNSKVDSNRADGLAKTEMLEEELDEARAERSILREKLEAMETKLISVQKAQNWLRSKVLGHDGRIDAHEGRIDALENQLNQDRRENTQTKHEFGGFRARTRRENAQTRGDMAKHKGRIGKLEGAFAETAELVISLGDDITPLYFCMCALLAIVLYSSSDQYEFMFEFEMAEQLKLCSYIAAVFAGLFGLLVLKRILKTIGKKGYAKCKKWKKQD